MPTAASPETLITIGSIAERLGVPVHRVRHVLVTRRIPPTAIAGGRHVFDGAVVDRVRAEIARIERDRQPPLADL